jgi:hypothetical protein
MNAHIPQEIPREKLNSKNLVEYLLQFTKKGKGTFRANFRMAMFLNGTFLCANNTQKITYHNSHESSKRMAFYFSKDMYDTLFFTQQFDVFVEHVSIDQWDDSWPPLFGCGEDIPLHQLDTLKDSWHEKRNLPLGVDKRLCYLLNTGKGVNIYRTKNGYGNVPFYYKIVNPDKRGTYVYQWPFPYTETAMPDYAKEGVSFREFITGIASAKKMVNSLLNNFWNLCPSTEASLNDTIEGTGNITIPMGEFIKAAHKEFDWFNEQIDEVLIPYLDWLGVEFANRLSKHDNILQEGISYSPIKTMLQQEYGTRARREFANKLRKSDKKIAYKKLKKKFKDNKEANRINARRSRDKKNKKDNEPYM